MLVTKRFAMIVTLKCTLKCKLCCNCVPMYRETPIIDKEELKNDISKAFELYDYIEWFQFVGGELFLHPDIAELMEKVFEYRNQFDKMVLMTNGTLLPNAATLEVLKSHKDSVEVQISDYGKLSRRLDDLINVLSENQIPYVVKRFHGDMQHYGGWVDVGDFSNLQESQEKVAAKFYSCWQMKLENLHCYKGKIHPCPRAIFAQDLNKVNIPADEYIDLRSESLSLNAKKEIAGKFKTKILTTCAHCLGFDSENAKRYPAAEQV